MKKLSMTVLAVLAALALWHQPASAAAPSYAVTDLGAVGNNDLGAGASGTVIVSDGTVYSSRDNGMIGPTPHLVKIAPDGTSLNWGSPVTAADGYSVYSLGVISVNDSGQALVSAGGQLRPVAGNPGLFKGQVYVRDANGNYYPLDACIPSTWTLSSPTSINATGQISAWAVPASDQWHTHLVVLTPLPATVNMTVLLPSAQATVASRSQIQTWQALVDGLSLGSYAMSWSVDSGQPNPMYDSQTGGAHKEAQVDMSGWTWRGSDGNGPYVIAFTAKDMKGNVIAQKAVTVTLTK